MALILSAEPQTDVATATPTTGELKETGETLSTFSFTCFLMVVRKVCLCVIKS